VSEANLWRSWLVALSFALAGLLLAVPGARAAGSEPLFVFTPRPSKPPSVPLPPPFGFFEGACGVGVDPLGHFYVSDYYHDVIDVYDQGIDYLGQLTGIDSLDGPCGLAFYGAGGALYVNDYHRAVLRYGPSGPGTTLVGPTAGGAHNATGVDVDPATGHVYVDQRTYVSVFDQSGAPLEEAGEPLAIGQGPLKDGYGLAFSSYPGTAGYLYVPDAATNTIEVYDSATPEAGPVEEIDGAETPAGEFVSLRDASIAVDRVTGEIYVVDDLQPKDTERPQAIVDVFHPDGTYEGHLQSLVTWGMPSGLAVDNSEAPTQGRVYVTSGNTALGSIYAYGPGAATSAPIALPSAASAGPSGTQGEQAAAPGPSSAAVAQPTQASLGAVVGAGAAPSPASPRPRSAKAHKKPRAHRAHKKPRAHRAHRRGVKRDR
jgi:hypothetical protein